MPRGENLKGKGGPGRPLGLQNKVTANLKEAIEQAFNILGGVNWLVKLAEEEPAAFASLLVKVLPKQLELSVDLDFRDRLSQAIDKARIANLRAVKPQSIVVDPIVN
jgi:hypothetical protein